MSPLSHVMQSFPDFTIDSKQRPDGYLLEFRSGSDIEFRRVLRKDCTAERDMDAFIHSLHRDLAQLSGRTPPKQSLRKLHNLGLPSYSHSV